MLETTGEGRRRIAATKLAAPEPPARLVSRPRLLARLAQVPPISAASSMQPPLYLTSNK